MQYGTTLRKECVTVNADGTYTVKGGGWFWCKIKRVPEGLAVLEMEDRMPGMKSSRLFILNAKATIEKHFPCKKA